MQANCSRLLGSYLSVGGRSPCRLLPSASVRHLSNSAGTSGDHPGSGSNAAEKTGRPQQQPVQSTGKRAPSTFGQDTHIDKAITASYNESLERKGEKLRELTPVGLMLSLQPAALRVHGAVILVVGGLVAFLYLLRTSATKHKHLLGDVKYKRDEKEFREYLVQSDDMKDYELQQYLRQTERR